MMEIQKLRHFTTPVFCSASPTSTHVTSLKRNLSHMTSQNCFHVNRFFWTRWGNGMIEVGQGVVVGASRLLFYPLSSSPHQHKVNSIGLASKGLRAQWLLGRVDGNIVSSNVVTEQADYKKLVAAPINKRKTWVLDIKACSKVL